METLNANGVITDFCIIVVIYLHIPVGESVYEEKNRFSPSVDRSTVNVGLCRSASAFRPRLKFHCFQLHSFSGFS